ncbi:MAG TPA: queuosine precursor transporter [Paracoccaceae bacterium]|nr:queuosine precursor transporter [Paracoccaceae bacterium]
MNRGILFGVIAMAVLVVAANILVQFLVGNWLTWGAFTYPFTFLVTDLMNRLYGPTAARKVVIAGFVTGIICSLIGTQIMLDFGDYSAPAVTLRIALGSGTAFLLAQLTDVLIFDRLRQGKWWRAPLVSSIVGSSLDTALFFSIAFSASLVFLEPANDVSWAGATLPLLGFGPVVPLWVSLGAADFVVKMLLAMIALVPFRVLSDRLKPSIA